MRVLGCGTALLALCFIAATSLVVIRRGGLGEPHVPSMHAECGRAAAVAANKGGAEVAIVEGGNAGGVAVGPSLVVRAVEPPAQRHDGLVRVVGQAVGADAIEPCDEYIHMVASTPARNAKVSPPAFVEDFNAGTISPLTVVENQTGSRAAWHVARGHLEARGGGGALFSPQSWEDYDAEVRLQFPDGVYNDAGLVFRVQNAQNWYQMRVDATRVRLMAVIEGHLQTVGEWPFDGVRDRLWHRLKVEVRGHRVTGYVDGLPIFSYNGVLLSSGAVGVMQDNVRVRYDDLIVMPIVAAARRR